MADKKHQLTTPEVGEPTSADQRPARSPFLFAVLLFGLPLVVIVLVEWIRLHS